MVAVLEGRAKSNALGVPLLDSRVHSRHITSHRLFKKHISKKHNSLWCIQEYVQHHVRLLLNAVTKLYKMTQSQNF